MASSPALTTSHDAPPADPSRAGGAEVVGSQRAACYSCPRQIEEGLARLGSPQCQDCRDDRRPISPERFLALGRGVVDGIDMVAIVRQRRYVGTPGNELEGMSWAA